MSQLSLCNHGSLSIGLKLLGWHQVFLGISCTKLCGTNMEWLRSGGACLKADAEESWGKLSYVIIKHINSFLHWKGNGVFIMWLNSQFHTVGFDTDQTQLSLRSPWGFLEEALGGFSMVRAHSPPGWSPSMKYFEGLLPSKSWCLILHPFCPCCGKVTEVSGAMFLDSCTFLRQDDVSQKERVIADEFYQLPSGSDNLFHNTEKCFTTHKILLKWD